ncbi:exonuclease domain-containing protein [Arthrobacter rhombi]|nr:exonuclease domain-containing protein [Arthrobacter rhombi]
MNFTAVDVETANGNRGSVCAVGVTAVRNGRIVQTVEWRVKPATGLGAFSPRNVAIHGITAEMVRSADSWATSLQAITSLAEDFPLVAYNAPFDRSAILQASQFSGLEAPANEFHCALALSRRLLALDGYKLSTVAAELGLDPFDHHRAGADATACAQIVLSLAEREGARNVPELWFPPKKSPVRTSDYWSKDKRSRIDELPQPNPAASPDHPFHGHQVIFTGELQTCDRWDAMGLVAHHGGTNGQGVTKKTRYLVVGGSSAGAIVDLANGTTKERKAARYIELGQEIQVLTEQQFMELVGRKSPSTQRTRPPSTRVVGPVRAEPKPEPTLQDSNSSQGPLRRLARFITSAFQRGQDRGSKK